jgi:hypothetical protein
LADTLPGEWDTQILYHRGISNASGWAKYKHKTTPAVQFMLLSAFLFGCMPLVTRGTAAGSALVILADYRVRCKTESGHGK